MWAHQLRSLFFSLTLLMDLPVTTPAAFTGDRDAGHPQFGLCFLILPVFPSQGGNLMGPLRALPSCVQRLANSEGGLGVQFVP